MDAIELLRRQTNESYNWLELTVSDVTAEQARWKPPGIANTIAGSYAHAVMWADIDINRHFFGRKSLLDGTWAERFGCDAYLPDEFGDAIAADWEGLREYGRLVHNWIVSMIGELDPAELDRKFQMVPERLGIWTGMDVLDLHCNKHIRMHGGEIACVKGLQGARGYLGGADAADANALHD
jgi:hypothetical protein